MKKSWLKFLVTILLTSYINASVYADAENKLTNDWMVYDNAPSYAKIRNVYDSQKKSRVISFLGQGTKNGYMLGGFNNSKHAWKNSTEKIIKWSMNYNEKYIFYVSLKTKDGSRYMLYSPSNKNDGKNGKYIYYGLGSNTIKGKWNHIVRNLEVDLKKFEPHNSILSINGFLVRGSGKIDDVSLVSSNKDLVTDDNNNDNNDNNNDNNNDDKKYVDEDVPGVFKHPGVLVTRGQLDFISKKIANGESPWKEAFDKMKESHSANKNFKPSPQRIVAYGRKYRSTKVMEIELKDASAAYTQALMWYFTKNKVYAKNSIKILNAWSNRIKRHSGTSKGLISSWSSVNFVRAAEIVRYSYSGWKNSDIKRFEKMLRNVYLVNTINGTSGNSYQQGNWELLMADATMSMGIFLNDKKVFNKGVALWRKRVPAYIYLNSDGTNPILVPEAQALQNRSPNWGIESYLWFGHNRNSNLAKRYANGMSQETCRDFGHVALGFAGMINAAETAYIQGVDLYKEEKKRIMAGVEFHTKYLNLNYKENSKGYRERDIESWLCPNNIQSGQNYVVIPNASSKTYEIVYNHYVNRMGSALPNTHDYIYPKRPTGERGVTTWETLTHGEIGNIGR